MGLSDATFLLYAKMAKLGFFTNISSVAELGSQTVWVQDPTYFRLMFKAFNQPLPEEEVLNQYLNTTVNRIYARSLYHYLGFPTYTSFDLNGACEAIVLDLNHDPVPAEHQGLYGFVTNHGTAEHVCNQANVFNFMHDLTALNGLMLNVSPYLGWTEHGFFNYHANFFLALAKANDYKVLGLWTNLDPTPELIQFEDLKNPSPGANYLLISLFQKTTAASFDFPVQKLYEGLHV